MKKILINLTIILMDIILPTVIFGIGYISGYFLALCFGSLIEAAFMKLGFSGTSNLIPTIVGAIFVIRYKFAPPLKEKEV